MLEQNITDTDAMEAFGARLADAITTGCSVFLIGELGAGKTTLVRGFMRRLGHTGAVKSPTYTLVEPYALSDRTVYHFDLYRLSDPEELELMGIRDYMADDAIRLIEWPQQGADYLGKADLRVCIEYREHGRRLTISAESVTGRASLERLTSS